MKEKVLFVGNGINNTISRYEWKSLLKNIAHEMNMDGQINFENKPFPLIYEEIYLNSIKKKRNKNNIRKRLKNFIISEIENWSPCPIHEKIIEKNSKNIITTNYDYTLEKVLNRNIVTPKNSGKVDENKYSIFRKNIINNTTFWHIHGEQKDWRTINLGYEQYCGYLQRIEGSGLES